MIEDELGNQREVVATLDKDNNNLIPFKNSKGNI